MWILLIIFVLALSCWYARRKHKLDEARKKEIVDLHNETLDKAAKEIRLVTARLKKIRDEIQADRDKAAKFAKNYGAGSHEHTQMVTLDKVLTNFLPKEPV
jgi:hypothetical protein